MRTRFVLHRAHDRRGLLAVTGAAILLATTLMTALVGYLLAVSDGAVRSALQDAGTSRTDVVLTAGTSGDELPDLDHAVRAIAPAALDGVPVEVTATWRSVSYALPRAVTSGGATALAQFAYVEGVETAGPLVRGRWPRPSTTPVQTAVPDVVADRLDLAVGDRLRLTNRLTGSSLRIEITGVFRPDRGAAPVWRGTPFGTAGVTRGAFTTYGPLVVPRQTFLDRLAGAGTARWRLAPDLSTLTTDRLPGLRAAVSDLTEQPSTDAALQGRLSAASGLPAVLSDAQRASTAVRSTLLVPLALLGLVLGFLVLATARLLAETRRGETSLLMSRGASVRQLAGTTARESLLVAVPAAVLGPLAAAPVSRSLAGAADLPAGATLSPTTWLVAGVTAGLCAAAVLAAAVQTATTEAASARAVRRPAAGAVQRAGVDLGLVAVAALLYWQLRDPDAVEPEQGLEPVLVLGPVVVVIALATVGVRLLPLIARLAQRITHRGRGLATALGTWEVARRPVQYGLTALLLALATATGSYCFVQVRTAEQSRSDGVAFGIGADVRVTAGTRIGDLPPLEQHAAYTRIAGVRSVMGVRRESAALGNAEEAQVLAVDAARAADVMTLRSDLAPVGLAAALGPVLSARPVTAGLRLPRDATSVVLRARLAGQVRSTRSLEVALLLRDGLGRLHLLPAGSLPADRRIHRLRVPLVTVPGGTAGPTTSLELLAVSLEFPLTADDERLRLEVRAIHTDEPDRVTLDRGGRRWRLAAAGATTAVGAPRPGRIRTGGPAGVFTTTFDTGAGDAGDTTARAQLVASVALPRHHTNDAVPVLVTRPLLESTGSGVGGRIDLPYAGVTVPAVIAGVVDGVPSVLPPAQAVLVDAGTVGLRAFLRSGAAPEPTEWWLATTPGRATAVRAAIERDGSLAAEVLDRESAVRSSDDDPFVAGSRTASLLAVAGALGLAALGLVVGLAASARRRSQADALLRALGAPSRDLRRAAVVEQLFVTGTSVVVGVVMGLCAARLVLPHTTLTTEGHSPFPPVAVELPWLRASLVAVAAVGAFAALVATWARLMHRHRPHGVTDRAER